MVNKNFFCRRLPHMECNNRNMERQLTGPNWNSYRQVLPGDQCQRVHSQHHFAENCDKASYYFPVMADRLIVTSCFSLHSLSTGPIHYRISWETRGLLPRDPSGDHTKEVIGIGVSFAPSINSGDLGFLLFVMAASHLIATFRHSRS